MLCVALLVCLFVCVCCVFDSVCELFGVVAISLLNVMKVCVVVLCWIDHVWSSIECVLCL